MADLKSTIVVPDLQNYYTKFLSSSQLNKSQYPHSVRIDDSYIPKNSFIQLLFDEYWIDVYDHYRYLYRDDNNVGGWPANIRDRAMLYPASAKYYSADNDSTSVCNINAFNLTNVDLTLLDALLKYRLTDSTSLIVIDTTSIISATFTDSTSSDSTAVLLVNYPNLTRLSKLIFLYLNLEINKDYSYYDNQLLISDPNNVLESTYESYIIEKMFIYIS